LSELAETKGRGVSGFNIVGWVLGGLSFLNLIHDLSPLKLYGLVKDWADGYQSLVKTVAGFLFGWINWRWIAIDSNEAHVIVLAILLGSATLRASMQEQMRTGQSQALAFIGALAGALLVIVLPVILLAALLPGVWGLVGSVAYLPWAAYEFGFRNSEADDTVPASKDVRREFLGIVAVFGLLIALNFALLMT
jgi:hypothetical protein